MFPPPGGGPPGAVWATAENEAMPAPTASIAATTPGIAFLVLFTLIHSHPSVEPIDPIRL